MVGDVAQYLLQALHHFQTRCGKTKPTTNPFVLDDDFETGFRGRGQTLLKSMRTRTSPSVLFWEEEEEGEEEVY